MKEGWSKILNLESQRMTGKHHFFREGMALCGKYILEGGDGFLEGHRKLPLKDDCKRCVELQLKVEEKEVIPSQEVDKKGG